jgi:predicted RNA-binding Zn-ribbon protein involved in translation (DUF1610 family)
LNHGKLCWKNELRGMDNLTEQAIACGACLHVEVLPDGVVRPGPSALPCPRCGERQIIVTEPRPKGETKCL